MPLFALDLKTELLKLGNEGGELFGKLRHAPNASTTPRVLLPPANSTHSAPSASAASREEHYCAVRAGVVVHW